MIHGACVFSPSRACWCAGTCEHGTTSNQLVALVLHSPGPQRDGEERVVQCDYWRFWSNSKGNAAQHHMAMRQIADFYKYGGPRPGAASAGERLGEGDLGEVEARRARRSPLVPGLKRLHVWSDGQRSQYKGEKNFGRNAEWPKSIDVGGMELELWHHFYESHHASGPQDNAGKDPRCAPAHGVCVRCAHRRFTEPLFRLPRRAMDAAILHEKAQLIYDYHKCYVWCAREMARPSDTHEHVGTWACNGEYHWRACSNGRDPHRHLYPNMPTQKREWYAVEGSNFLYCFRAGPGVNRPGINELQISFLSCFCQECRADRNRSCLSLRTVRQPFWAVMREKQLGRARPPTRRSAAAAATAAAAAAPVAAAPPAAAEADTVTAALTATGQTPAPGAAAPVGIAHNRPQREARVQAQARIAAAAAGSPPAAPATPAEVPPPIGGGGRARGLGRARGRAVAAPRGRGRGRGRGRKSEPPGAGVNVGAHQNAGAAGRKRVRPNDADGDTSGDTDGDADGDASSDADGDADGGDVDFEFDENDDDASDTEHQGSRLAMVAFA